MTNKLLSPPCAYQGGKQRVSKEIIDYIMSAEIFDLKKDGTSFFDLCCGSGAISLELINRGMCPSNIIMCDISSWGKFWKSVGDGVFSVDTFNWYCNQVPKDKGLIQDFLKELSTTSADEDEEYKYILLQAGAFGGKQIWKQNGKWQNTSFRNYWQPTITSKRRSPVNPMQPSIENLRKRVINIAENCVGLNVINDDIYKSISKIKKISMDLKHFYTGVIYIDPPYKETTPYGFEFDINKFISELKSNTDYSIYVSEKEPISIEYIKLKFNGAKGGISGNKTGKNEEYLNIYQGSLSGGYKGMLIRQANNAVINNQSMIKRD